MGCGAIGSFVALFVGKMCGENVSIVLWDADTIEEHNLAVQMFPKSAVGQLKVAALAKLVEEFDGPVCTPMPQFVTEEDLLSGIVLSCVDDLEPRRAILKAAEQGGAEFLVDGRMGAEVLRVLSCDMADAVEVELYRSTLAPGPTVQESCTARSIIYTVGNAAGLMVAVLKQYLKGEERKAQVLLGLKGMDWMDVPFFRPEKSEEPPVAQGVEVAA